VRGPSPLSKRWNWWPLTKAIEQRGARDVAKCAQVFRYALPRVFASPGAFKFEVAAGTSRSYYHLFQCILVPLGSHAAINLSLLD